jgi:hypothetical protein
MPQGTQDALARLINHGSYQHLEAFAGNLGKQKLFLSRFAWQSAFSFFDDFDGDTINLDKYVVAETGTGTPFAKPSTDLANGVITGVTGGTDNNVETLCGYRQWLGDHNCWVEFKAKSDVVDANALEMGFFDAATNTDVPIVSDVDTPALAGGTSNAALLHYDTDQTLVTMALVTDGSTSNMNTTALTLSPTFVPTAATYHTYLVGIAGDIAFAMVDGKNLTTTSTGAIGQRVEGGTLLRFWLAVRTRAGAAVTVDIDYIAAAQDRLPRVA